MYSSPRGNDVCWCVVSSVISHDSVFEVVDPPLRHVISSVESEEENIYDCPRPARGLLLLLCLYCRPGVAKVRPTGQIRPASSVHPARGGSSVLTLNSARKTNER